MAMKKTAKKAAVKAIKKAVAATAKPRSKRVRDTAPKAETHLGGSNKQPRNADGLTPREALFVLEYLRDENQTQAAIRVGHSPRSAHQLGYKYMKRPHVLAEIKRVGSLKLIETEVTLERALIEVGRIALLDPRKLQNADGSYKSLLELDDATAAAVSGIEVVEREGERVEVPTTTRDGQELEHAPPTVQTRPLYTKKYKTHSKIGALELVLRRHGAFEKDNRQRSDPIVELLREIGANGNGLPIKK